jgi:hypothetical protein
MSNHVLANTHIDISSRSLNAYLFLYVSVSFLQSCWMHMSRLTCGFGEHIAVESRCRFLGEHDYSTLVNRIMFSALLRQPYSMIT